MHPTAPRAARAAALLALIAAHAAAFAQDGAKDPVAPPGPPVQPEGTPPAPPSEAAEKIAERMADLYGRAAGEAPRPNPLEPDAKVKAQQIKRLDEWTEAAKALAKAADTYLERVGTAAPSARALFWGGYGKAVHANVLDGTKVQAQAERATAVKLLQRSLEGLPADADFRMDALLWLGKTQLFLVSSGGADLTDAVANLREATVGLLRAKRPEDAAAAVVAALKQLNASNKLTEARDFVAATGAAKADFGRRSGDVRTFVAMSATAVGAPLPSLPDFTDTDGKPVRWKAFLGSPVVIHFFAAGDITGRTSNQRDIETTLRPLYDRLHPRGLVMIGVSMDREIPRDEADRIQRRREEDGTKEVFEPGTKSSVQRYAEVQGITWPWSWDGKWQDNPVSLALGGVGTGAAHAVLVDAMGVIRWRGDAPFQGLAEAADKAVGEAKK